MTRPLRIQYPGAHYHITSRGNERKSIFRDSRDREKFLSYLQSAHLRYKVIIHVFCLMGNHYHLLLETPKGNLSSIMRHVNGAYTNYFNMRHRRRGHLFQGRYKAILIEADSYAGELSRYIHLNPVRAGIASLPEKYKWSSYRYYAEKRKVPDWLELDLILSYFSNDLKVARKKYDEFVKARVNAQYTSPLEGTVASMVLGSSNFIEFVRDRYVGGKRRDRNLPALKQLVTSPDIEKTYKAIELDFNGHASLSKKATLYLFHKFSDRSLKEIGKSFGIGESAVSDASRQFGLLLEKNHKLRKQVESLRVKLHF